jgi:methionyl-tRNA formyltransferase
MRTFVLLTEKKWHVSLFDNISSSVNFNWIRISKKSDFNIEVLDAINPEIIFIPHWSYIIPDYIFDKYTCIVFHMTDLPYGRGGSPLQNLIIRGMKNTKISAIRVIKDLDAGDCYLKRDLSLEGTAKDIFLRSVPIIEEMIDKIIKDSLQPTPQNGDPIIFKRRTPGESSIIHLSTIDEIYDYIRMLDCEGYPPAFIETKYIKIEFRDAEVVNEKQLNANVKLFLQNK